MGVEYDSWFRYGLQYQSAVLVWFNYFGLFRVGVVCALSVVIFV